MSEIEIRTEISETIGFDAAFRLLTMRAGASFYVPADPPPHHWLRSILAPEELAAFAKRYGGDTISLPTLPDRTSHKIEVAVRNGLSNRDIALLVGRSEREVRRHRARMQAVEGE